MTDLSFADLIAMREELRRLIGLKVMVVGWSAADEEFCRGYNEKLNDIEAEIKRRLV
jgi:hypothetical protein